MRNFISTLLENYRNVASVADGWTAAVVLLTAAAAYATVRQELVLRELEATDKASGKDALIALADSVASDELSAPEARAQLARHLRRGLVILNITEIVAPTTVTAATYGKVAGVAIAVSGGQLAELSAATAQFSTRLLVGSFGVVLTGVVHAVASLLEPRVAAIEARLEGLMAAAIIKRAGSRR